MQSPGLRCANANCPDPESVSASVRSLLLLSSSVVVVVVDVLVSSKTSSYRAFVTVSFRGFALLCQFERICRPRRSSSCWPFCFTTIELTASYTLDSVCLEKKIMFDHIYFLPLTNTSLQSACNKSRREKKNVLLYVQHINLTLILSLDFNSYICALHFTCGYFKLIQQSLFGKSLLFKC